MLYSSGLGSLWLIPSASVFSQRPRRSTGVPGRCLDARGLAGGKNVSRLSHSSNKLPNLSAQHCKRGVPAIIEVTDTKGHHQSMGNRGLSTDEMGRLLAPLSYWRQRIIYICQDTSFGPIVGTPKVIT